MVAADFRRWCGGAEVDIVGKGLYEIGVDARPAKDGIDADIGCSMFGVWVSGLAGWAVCSEMPAWSGG